MADCKEINASSDSSQVTGLIPSAPMDSTSVRLLLSLPPELIDEIVGHLPYLGGLYPLILTCTSLFHRYYLDHVETTLDVLDSVVFYLEGVEEGQFGWKPFTVPCAFIDVWGDPSDEGLQQSPPPLRLFCHEHDMAEFHLDRPTRDYLIVEVTEGDDYEEDERKRRGSVSLYWQSKQWLEGRVEVKVEWGPDIRSRLRRATPEVLKERFGPCPECQDKGEIWCGTEEISRRWPDIFSDDYGFGLPCPRCVSPYDEVARLHDRMLYSFDRGDNEEEYASGGGQYAWLVQYFGDDFESDG